jgi:serine/threonine protein kinase
VEHVLGKGGMGSVYRASNRDAPSIVRAVKLLDPSFQFNPEAKERFLREAEILYTIDHPNVVRVANVDLDARPPYLEMEFVDGPSLEDELARLGPFPPSLALDRARQLADALHYLHRRKIFHRDVKPQNILLHSDGLVKLVDFGLAVQTSGGRRITHAAAVTNFGTVSYCPPEWGRGQLDPVTWDLYALGVVLYEMLTGSVAFPMAAGLDGHQQMLQVLSDKKRIPALDPGPHFAPDLRAVVRKLTHRDPAERFPDARALCTALEDVELHWAAPTPVAVRTTDPTPMPLDTRTPPPARPSLPSTESISIAGFVGTMLFGGLFVGTMLALIVLVLIPLLTG